MAMSVDNRQQSQMSGLPYQDGLRYQQTPQFSNPWVGTTGAAPSSMYSASLAPTSSGPMDSSQQMRPAALNLHYAGAPTTSAPLGSGLLNTSRSYGSEYSSPSPNAYAPSTTSGSYPLGATANYGFQAQDASRRPSHPLSDPSSRSSFSEAIEASRNMISMRDSDITPRNIYGAGPGDRSSVSSYGFPSTHSAHSSISSASYGPYSYSASVGGDSSVTDYSSASESVDMNSRTLPRPTSLVGANIPAPQSMMSQFSSKVASSSQKKHKCKICDKRFTRPSSLQTHMYSHTGEKPFACEVEGCGRHFSVVSNLRRHRKVHKNDGDHDDHPSPDE